MSQIKILHDYGYNQLSDYQKTVYEICIRKGSGGLALKMGAGKTIISIVIALRQCHDIEVNQGLTKKILVVSSLTLLESWKSEIKKFYKNCSIAFNYETLTTKTNGDWTPNTDTVIIFANPDTLRKAYNDNELEARFVEKKRQMEFGPEISYYNYPNVPLLNRGSSGISYLYSRKYGSFIIDEAQGYLNIEADRTRAMASISSCNIWLLSGTLIDEPKKVPSLIILLNYPNFPRNVPDIMKFIRSREFIGTNQFVVDLKNTVVTAYNINKQIVTHNITPEECIIYLSLRNTLKELKKTADNARDEADTEVRKKFSGYCLALITYLRETIISPLIPLTYVTLNMLDYENKSDLSKILLDKLKEESEKQGISLDSILHTSNITSSRIKTVIDTLEKHVVNKDKILIFSSFLTSIDLMSHIIGEHFGSLVEIYRIHSSMKSEKRGQIVDKFNETEIDSERRISKIFLMTYTLGSEGLNLQTANTVLLTDIWWNTSKTNQSIARIARQGQLASELYVYLFTSNTGIENAVMNKNSDKLTILDEMLTGPQTSVVPAIKIDEIIRLIDVSENYDILNDILNGKLRKVSKKAEIDEDGNEINGYYGVGRYMEQ